MNFQLTDEQILIQQTAREFAQVELAPGAIERDEKKIWPAEAVKKIGKYATVLFAVSGKSMNFQHYKL